MINLYNNNDTSRLLSSNADKKTYLSDFRRDYARVIHSASFRRMQGKTQIYPSYESDFFRNRLTHSLEVAQISKSISLKLNFDFNLNINTDLAEVSGLCHDIGHPPFGHNGEKALQEKMYDCGGFEGNAQTLRLLAITEKKNHTGKAPIENGNDNRLGLNLCFRTLASVLKYDNEIPLLSNKNLPVKGYYQSEASIVKKIKTAILGNDIFVDNFKTIECQIMDISDDIAYSTYDIEDAFKAGFLTPNDMIYADKKLLNLICEQLKNKYKNITISTIQKVIRDFLKGFIHFNENSESIQMEVKNIAQSSYLRTALTSKTVNKCIDNVNFIFNKENPCLSKVFLNEKLAIQVDVLKQFIYLAVITSPRMNIVRYRSAKIISTLFDILMNSTKLNSLLPDDVANLFFSYSENEISKRKRIICDYISSMTDRYAIELYNRLKNNTEISIFKPI